MGDRRLPEPGRLGILTGLVPLPEMSQHEVDWVFEQKLRMAGGD